MSPRCAPGPQTLICLTVAEKHGRTRTPQLDLYRGVISPGLILKDIGVHVVGIDDDDIGGWLSVRQ